MSRRNMLIVALGVVMCVSAVLWSAVSAEGSDAEFKFSVQRIPDDVLAKMEGRSWEASCPMHRSELAYMELSYWGFDDQVHTGTIVTHEYLAPEVVEIFRELFEIRFPIEKMQPYEDFGVSEYAAYNDTVGFYCRPDQADPTECSSHCYGYAVDINPMVNPYNDPTEGWWPLGSAEYASRDEEAKGKITVDSKVVEIFARHGWWWNGLDTKSQDYMHFEKGTFGNDGNLPERPCQVTGIEVRAN